MGGKQKWNKYIFYTAAFVKKYVKYTLYKHI